MRRVGGVSGMLLWRWEECFKVGGKSFHTSASLWSGRHQHLSSLIKAYSFFVCDEGTSPIHHVVGSFPFQI